MKDIALHLLEVLENSMRANSTTISVHLKRDEKSISFYVKDNGCGMDECQMKSLRERSNPRPSFSGIGLSKLFFDAESTGGRVLIDSKLNEGTSVYAEFFMDTDTKPNLGDVHSVISVLVSQENLAVKFCYRVGNTSFVFDSVEFEKTLSGKRYMPDAVRSAREFIKENIEKLNGGLAI